MMAAWIHLSVGVLLAVVSIPLWMEKVPRNGWYGLRIQKSMESDENWYRINRFGGQGMFVVGALIAMIGLANWLRPPQSEAMTVLLLTVPLFLVLPWLVVVVWYAGRL